jgi:hypothetical protein
MRYKRLNWKDEGSGSSAHAARDVGGKYEISRHGGPDEIRNWPNPIKPFHYRVEWYQEMFGLTWWADAMTLEEAKALAEQVHHLAWTKTRECVRHMQSVVEEVHKKAPRESADFKARMEQAIRELNKDEHTECDNAAGQAA